LLFPGIRIDIDYLESDQLFAQHLAIVSTEQAFCKALITIAHSLDIEIIAECVETKLHRN